MKRLLKITTILGIIAGSTAMAIFCAVFLYLNPKLPSIDVLKESNLQVPLRIYSQNGTLIGEYGEKFRTPIKSDDLPRQLVQALLAAEDDRFMEHSGIDIAGLLRAASELLTTGSIQTGGSTITMQVARNYFLSSEQTFVRKFKEILLAIKIERMLSKADILELYVNKIYLGKRAYGVQAAAAIYYGTSINKLDLAQLAMIAGLPKAPSSYNPVNNPDRALVRRNWIIGRMQKLGYIDESEMLENIEKPITAKYYGPKLQLDAGYPAEMARRFIFDMFGDNAYNSGYKVITTVQDDAQISSDAAVQNGLLSYTERHGYRGPEYRLGQQPLEEQIALLNDLNVVNSLHPALVLDITESSEQSTTETSAKKQSAQKEFQLDVKILLPRSQAQIMRWQASKQTIQKYISENRRSKPVSDLRKLLKKGDIIRVTQQENGEWRISQLPTASASLVALDPSNGAIRAISGGFDYKQSEFNRATQAYRQPGSNFKPFIYAAALDNGFTAASIINDAPIVFSDRNLESDWRPENASGKFYGPTTLRKALYKSRNLVSVRLLRELGIDSAIRYLERFNLSGGKLPRDLSLALGSHALTPIEVASLYSVIANGGFLVEPFLVAEIRDRKNKLIYKASPTIACEECETEEDLLALLAQDKSDILLNDTGTGFDEVLDEAADLSEILDEAQSSEDIELDPTAIKPRLAERIVSADVAFIIDDILKDTIQRGTATKAKDLGRTDIAGKTGTTNGPTDAWFSGYHPNLVATTWLGFDDNAKIGKREFGGTAALPIWMDFMSDQLPTLNYAKRRQPEGVVAIRIDTDTGELANPYTENADFEFFLSDTVPEQITLTGSASPEIAREIEAISEDLF